MENMIYCLNATMPIFLTMVLGFLLHRLGLISDLFAGQLNRFVFQISLPVLVFQDMARSDFFLVWDGKFVLFCLIATALSILISALLSLLLGERGARGEFIQASYRSGAALLGAALHRQRGDPGQRAARAGGTAVRRRTGTVYTPVERSSVQEPVQEDFPQAEPTLGELPAQELKAWKDLDICILLSS